MSLNFEKRRYERALFDCEILYPTIIYDNKKQTLMENMYKLNTIDISEAGICFQSNFLIPENSFVSFYLRVEGNLPFKTLVKIRWNTIKNSVCISGGEFVALNLEEIHILRNYVKNHS